MTFVMSRPTSHKEHKMEEQARQVNPPESTPSLEQVAVMIEEEPEELQPQEFPTDSGMVFSFDSSPPALDTDTPPGRLGPYRLLKKVGSGSMGMVYRAQHTQTSRTFALKVIPSHKLVEDDQRRRFVIEAETGALLKHPNIVSVYDVGQEQGFHYIVMDYVESISLSNLLEEQPLECDTAARVALSLADTLAYVHQEGILHRDLKPPNILVDASGQPWLTDFGVAKKMLGDDWQTATGMLIGTPSYMPPEQIAGKQELLGPPSDVYALGALLYEMLTGHPPFRSDNPFDTLQLALYTAPTPPRRTNSKVPKSLEAICLKCLSKLPQQRYLTAGALAEDLRAFLQNKAVSASRVTASWRHSDSWNHKTGAGLRDPEILAQWSKAWSWSAVLVFVLFLCASLLEGTDLPMDIAFPALFGAGVLLTGVIIWYQRFYRAKPLTPLEWQVARLWVLFCLGAAGVLIMAFQMEWSWQQQLPVLLLLGAMAFGCMTLFVDWGFVLLTCFCTAFAGIVMMVPHAPPVLFGTGFALGLYFPARRFKRN